MAFFKEAPDGVSCPQCCQSLTDKNINPGGKAQLATNDGIIPVSLGQTAEFPFGDRHDSLTHAKVLAWRKHEQSEDAKLRSFHAII